MFRDIFSFAKPVPFAWVIRSNTGSFFGATSTAIAVAAIAVLLLIERSSFKPYYERELPAWLDIGLFSSLTLATVLFGAYVKVSFIYFQF